MTQKGVNIPSKSMILCLQGYWPWHDFHQLGPLGRVGLVVTKSVCKFYYVFVPFPWDFFEASHWPSGHMREFFLYLLEKAFGKLRFSKLSKLVKRRLSHQYIVSCFMFGGCIPVCRSYTIESSCEQPHPKSKYHCCMLYVLL